MRFYLGTHKARWLWNGTLTVPAFVTRRAVREVVNLRPSLVPWALDSGGFTELSRPPHAWRITPEEYADEVRRYSEEIGRLEWAAPQDWMCEPDVIAGTGLSVREHQRRTVESVLRLRTLAPDLPIIPVVQGFTVPEYLEHLTMYAAAGVDLTAERVVGVGSVCRRQDTSEAATIFEAISDRIGPRLHGFGLKGGAFALGLDRWLTSADSLAWSYNARRNPPLPGCAHGKDGRGRCNNCPRFALAWRERALRRGPDPRQAALF